MQNLGRMGIREEDQDHPVFGNVKNAVDALSKQRYDFGLLSHLTGFSTGVWSLGFT